MPLHRGSSSSVVRWPTTRFTKTQQVFEKKLDPLPCPFYPLLDALSMGFGLNDLTDEHGSHGFLMIVRPQLMMSIIDPESHCSYCFVSFPGFGFLNDLPMSTQLSATQYLCAYYPENSDEADWDEIAEESALVTLRPFESVPMLTIQRLGPENTTYRRIALNFPLKACFHDPRAACC
jgi:hypothetical protein